MIAQVIDKKGLKMVKELKEHVKKEWGEKCKDYSYACFVCGIYRALETLESIME